jgi:hypothetical protein
VVADTVDGNACVFLGGLYGAERVIAERLRRLMSEPLPWAYIDPEKALPWIERKTGSALADSQRSAISLTLRSKVLVITGGPGSVRRSMHSADSGGKKRFSGLFGLFRFLCPSIGAEQMAKRRQNLYMVAYNFRNCQQRSRE